MNPKTHIARPDTGKSACGLAKGTFLTTEVMLVSCGKCLKTEFYADALAQVMPVATTMPAKVRYDVVVVDSGVEIGRVDFTDVEAAKKYATHFGPQSKYEYRVEEVTTVEIVTRRPVT